MSITVITGPPGAGKTTVSALLATSSPLGVHVVADEFFHWIASGYVAPWLPDADRQNATVIAAVGAAVERYAHGGYDVVVDGIIGPWFLGAFRRGLGPTTIHYVVLRPGREVVLRRASGAPDRETW